MSNEGGYLVPSDLVEGVKNIGYIEYKVRFRSCASCRRLIKLPESGPCICGDDDEGRLRPSFGYLQGPGFKHVLWKDGRSD